MDLGAGYGQMALSQSTLSGTRAIGSTGKEAFSKPAADDKPADEPPSSETFAFDRSDAVTKLVNQHFAESKSRNHPELREQIREEVESGQYQDYFDDLLDEHDFDRDDLADVIAAFYMSLWKIMHGQELTDRQIAGVRRQLLALMAKDARLTGLSDVEKQEMAEQLAYSTMIAGAAYQQLKRSGDTAQLAALREGVRRNVLASGVDLRRTELTNGGLVVR